MKKYLKLILTSLLLVGCNNTNSSNISTNSNNNVNESVSKYSDFVTDKQLTQTEENYYIHDNKIIVNKNGGRDLADPFVYRFNGWYYLYPTTGNGYQRGFKSQDLYNWEPVNNGVNREGYVYEYAMDPNRPASQTPFAPEVIYFNGMFYMISSPSGNGHYVFESESPEGPFSAISGNIGKSIDGSYFIDSNEDIYLYGASSGAIKIYGMEDDFMTIATNEDGIERENLLSTCKIGGWNEGPYMLQRNGEYYLTYCGSHYLSASYRIDYAHVNEGENLFTSSSYVREDTVIVSTKDTFKGLGHSSTVLGPDMDSYVIAYHNLNGDRSRNLCFSRLSFNGSMMVANSVVEEGAIGVMLPPFSTEDDSGLEEQGNFILSPTATEDNFTAEFNNVGEGQMIFSYQDDTNYSFIEFKNNDITINKKEKGVDTLIHKIDLIREYDIEAHHSFRIQHRDGKINLYFDNIEKAYSIDGEFKGGKIGYSKNNTFDEIRYTAFSNVAIGSSDNEYYADTVSLANGFDEELSYFQNGFEYFEPKKTNAVQPGNKNIVIKTKDDHATYRMYAQNDGTYNVNLRIPSEYLGKTYGLRVDDGEIIQRKLTSENLKYEKGDVYLTLGEVELDYGTHNISIYNVGDEIAFSKMEYEIVDYGDTFELDFNESADLSAYKTYNINSATLTNNGLSYSGNDLVAVVSKDEYNNYSVEGEFEVEELDFMGVVGIMFNVTDFSKNCNEDGDDRGNVNMFRGYRLSLQQGSIYLEYVDFNFGKVLKAKTFDYKPNKSFTLSADVNGNDITCYLNGEVIFTVSGNVGNLNGQVGAIISDCTAKMKKIYMY